MGKPSVNQSKSQRSSSNKSSRDHLPTTTMNRAMSHKKLEKQNRKKRNRTNKNIKKLFDHLRNESRSSLGSIFSEENTVIDLEKTPSKKRALSDENIPETGGSKRRKTDDTNESLIIINEDGDINNITCIDATPTKTPTVLCSTPIPNKDKNVLQNFIVSNNSNNNKNSQNLNENVNELTNIINRDSFITIDLTNETINASNSKTPHTVIDLVNTSDNPDCTLVSVSQTNLSMSGDSDVTVLNLPNKKKSKDKQMRRFAQGIATMNASEKGRLLDLITQNILGGCNVPARVPERMQGGSKTNLNIGRPPTQEAEPVENAYIKEVILGQTASRNSIGSNIYNPERDIKNKTGLRMVVIDGSNVAMEHGRGKVFSVKGLRTCIDYFIKRGHAVKAFVPRFRCKFGKSSDPRLLDELERRGLVVYTPSREIQGRMVASYDDRYIVQCAAEFDGVIVSGDNYRDLLLENPRWRRVIENRVLPFTWVEDMIMFPRDPLGRNGPTLEQFLKH